MTDRSEPSDAATEALFSSISAQAQETNRIRIEALAELLQGSTEGGSVDEHARAKDLAHQIAGSAGTFGYARASDLAREIESMLFEDPDGPTRAVLRQRISELRDAIG